MYTGILGIGLTPWNPRALFFDEFNHLISESMVYINFTIEAVRDYYNGDFSRDLRCYFIVDPPGSLRDYPMIPFMSLRFNKLREQNGNPALSAEGKVRILRNFIFSGICYFMFLIPQTIRQICGEGPEIDFYRCTGWPLSSVGMSDYLPPMKILEEASLLPSEGERDNYYSMLNMVTPFMIHEFLEYIIGVNTKNLNHIAYFRFRNAIADHASSLINRIVTDAMNFTSTFRPRLRALNGDIFDLDESKYDAAIAFVHGGSNNLNYLLRVNNELIAKSKIKYVIYHDSVHRDLPYRQFISDFRRFANEQVIVDYIKKMIPESLDFALKFGNCIAFHGLQIHGWNEEKNEKLTVSVVRDWLDKHPEVTVTMVDINGCFGKYVIETEKQPMEIYQTSIIADKFFYDQDYERAARYAITKDYISISDLQRFCSIGYNRAFKLMYQLVQTGVVKYTENGKYKVISVHLKSGH